MALNPSQPPALGLSLGFLAGEVDMLITLPLPGCVRTKLKTYTPRGLFPDLPRENGTARPHPQPADVRAERQKVEEKGSSKGGSGSDKEDQGVVGERGGVKDRGADVLPPGQRTCWNAPCMTARERMEALTTKAHCSSLSHPPTRALSSAPQQAWIQPAPVKRLKVLFGGGNRSAPNRIVTGRTSFSCYNAVKMCKAKCCKNIGRGQGSGMNKACSPCEPANKRKSPKLFIAIIRVIFPPIKRVIFVYRDPGQFSI